MKEFKQIAFWEGISLLLLFFVAMPIKYILKEPIFVKYIGLAHGILFITYIVWATYLKFKLNWKWVTFAIICLASFIPFGTFNIERKYLNRKNTLTN